MAELADGSSFNANALANLAMKRMLVAGINGDLEGVRSAYGAAMSYYSNDPAALKVLRYDYALAEYEVGEYEDAWTHSFDLLMDYYDDLNIDVDDVLLVDARHVRSLVPDTPERDDLLRHIGDCLDLMARCHRHLGRPAGMAYLHAMKFYSAAAAGRSAVKAGQDAVDAVLEIGDSEGARQICEELLLPVVMQYDLVELLVPVRAQYAVVLAWCGDIDAARAEMNRINSYRISESGAAELANQRALIERIAESHRALLC
jgi:hypothetical protein